MPRVGFEPTISVFVRAKTVHALDCAAIVIGIKINNFYLKYCKYLTKFQRKSFTSLGNVCNTHRSVHIRKIKGEIFVKNFLYFPLLKVTVSYSNSS
jgi:hypothetical protein